jgi:hypothetical protein
MSACLMYLAILLLPTVGIRGSRSLLVFELTAVLFDLTALGDK